MFLDLHEGILEIFAEAQSLNTESSFHAMASLLEHVREGDRERALQYRKRNRDAVNARRRERYAARKAAA